MNRRAKGNEKELECLAVFKDYMSTMPAYTLMLEWHTSPKYRHFKGHTILSGNDLLDCWDLALLYHYRPYPEAKPIAVQFQLQVKSDFQHKFYKELQELYKGSLITCYLACYRGRPRIDEDLMIKHKNYYFVRV